MKKKMVMNRDAPYLAQEIITEILIHLPVKSLIKFQCVCKEWKNLFKTSPFIANHLHHSTLQNSCLIFKSRSYQWSPRNLRLINHDMHVLEHHTPSSVSSCDIVGSSNGLLCLESKPKSLILWNPATRELLRVPKAPNNLRYSATVFGFGFSLIVNDYKIVVLSYSILNHNVLHSVQLFSFSKRSWKDVDAGKLKGVKPFEHICGFTFDGAIFWPGFGFKPYGGQELEYWLISFDITTELFILIPVPRSVNLLKSSRLTTYGNKLALLSDIKYESKMGITESLQINVWVMEKCTDKLGKRWTWNKICTINPYPHCSYILSPQTIWRNRFIGEAGGAVNRIEREFVLNDLHTNEFKTLAIGKYPITTQVWYYAESLVSLGNIHMDASC